MLTGTSSVVPVPLIWPGLRICINLFRFRIHNVSLCTVNLFFLTRIDCYQEDVLSGQIMSMLILLFMRNNVEIGNFAFFLFKIKVQFLHLGPSHPDLPAQINVYGIQIRNTDSGTGRGG